MVQTPGLFRYLREFVYLCFLERLGCGGSAGPEGGSVVEQQTRAVRPLAFAFVGIWMNNSGAKLYHLLHNFGVQLWLQFSTILISDALGTARYRDAFSSSRV